MRIQTSSTIALTPAVYLETRLIVRKHLLLAAAWLATFVLSAAHADEQGPFLGASIGQGEIGAYDKKDTAWKLLGGYNWKLDSRIHFGIEVGYVDFGRAKSSAVLLDDVVFSSSMTASGFNVWGVGGITLGPVDIFGKLGRLAWDGEHLQDNTVVPGGPPFKLNLSGTDFGYGIGAEFNFARFAIRSEWERYDEFDLSGAETLTLGVTFKF